MSALQFNFSNPGARSLGMAGAFTARADDATAVYANPAGLIRLSRPEFSFEGRYWTFSNIYVNQGTQLQSGGISGLDLATTDDSLGGPSFISGFYPSKSGRWTVGVFAHQLVDFKTRLETQGTSIAPYGSSDFVRPETGELELRIPTLGAAFAIKVGRGFSLGVTAAFARFKLDSRTELWDALGRTETYDPNNVAGTIGSLDESDPTVGNYITEKDPSLCCQFGDRGDVLYLRTLSGTDDALSFGVGALWESPKLIDGVPIVTLGLTYRNGPKFKFSGESFFKQMGSGGPGGTLFRSYDPEFPAKSGQFQVPSVYGFGVSARPASRWLLSFDFNRVLYSDLVEFMTLVRTGIINYNESDFEIEDGSEYRLGCEYAFPPQGARPALFIRAGAWLDPAHELRYTGNDPIAETFWFPDDDEIHYAAGFGARFRDWQLDLGADLSDRADTVSLSAIFYFGRH